MSEIEQRLATLRLDLLEAEIARLQAPRPKDGFWGNPLIIAVVGATATAIVGLVTNQLQLSASRQLERDKLESSLILKAIESDDANERLVALQFLVKAGLVTDTQGKITNLREEEIPRIVERTAEGISTDFVRPLPITYSQEIVDRILRSPAVPYAQGITPPPPRDKRVTAIVLHAAYAPDSAVRMITEGRPDMRGPLAHWVVLSDGTIQFIADESQIILHAGRADRGISNQNSIAIETTGRPAFADDTQIENLVRLAVDVADRWSVPTDMIVSHAEIALPAGRKPDMQQQAPEIRKMVEAVRKGRAAQASRGRVQQ